MVILTDQRKLMENFKDVEPARVQRNGQAYVDTDEFIRPELERYLAMYRELDQISQRGRLIRDQIDELIRRYHDYVIAGKIVAHYRQVGCRIKKGNVFEHVIPARSIRNMLIQGICTLDQALNAPTCLVTPKKNKVLADNKLTKSTPNAWFFWRRYDVLNIQIETYDGTPVDQATWDFAKHCDYFNVK